MELSTNMLFQLPFLLHQVAKCNKPYREIVNQSHSGHHTLIVLNQRGKEGASTGTIEDDLNTLFACEGGAEEPTKNR